MTRIAVVGLGNVGYWTTMGLCLAVLGNPAAPWDIALVDFDDVDERAVKKGYPPSLVGCRKPQALLATVETTYGVRVASAMRPTVAAAQSVPGLLADRDLFICVDSLGDAQFASEQARSRWQCRVSTGAGERATHCIEVFPPDTAALGDIYDDAAHAQASRRRSCLTGEPDRPLDGAAYPAGIVTGALALQAYLNRAVDLAPYRLQLTGTHPSRSDFVLNRARKGTAYCHLDLDNRATIDDVWQAIARDLNVRPEDVMVVWQVPFVRRHCACRTDYVGFERYPVTGRCPKCDKTSVLVTGRQEMLPDDARAFERRTLRSLHAPAGIALRAITSNGGSRDYRLSYRDDDVPPLADDIASPPISHPMEGLRA